MSEPTMGTKRCESCKGKGEYRCDECLGDGNHACGCDHCERECDECFGVGVIPCEVCKKTGRVPLTESDLEAAGQMRLV